MFSVFRDADQLENVEQQLAEMLASCQDAFRLATSATFGEEDVQEAGAQLMALDKDINRTERAIRRVLTYMSLAKDIERIGDKCKDIWELAEMGADLSIGSDSEELQRHRAHVAELIEDTLDAFAREDAEKVHELIQGIQEDEDHYDAHVQQFVMTDLPSREAAPRALFYRYIKRLSKHLSNVLSSIVMPVDQLDFYNPEKAIDETESD